MVADWDKRYKEGCSRELRSPHALLVRFAPAIPPGRVIDIAMGAGRDLMFLAGKGFSVAGVERSGEAIRLAGAGSQWGSGLLGFVQADAARLPLKEGSAAAVIMFYFLLREISKDIIGIMQKGGLLICETFLKRQNSIDRWRNPDYLLDDGELLDLFRGLETIFYEEGIRINEGRARATAQYVGRKG